MNKRWRKAGSMPDCQELPHHLVRVQGAGASASGSKKRGSQGAGSRPNVSRNASICSANAPEEPLLAQIAAASVQGTVATGERAGALCYGSRGFSLHAATRLEATERRRLEKLCRYVVRLPVAAGRLRFVDPETFKRPRSGLRSP